MQKYINNIILAINLSNTHDANPIKAQNAGVIDLSILWLFRYSHIRAHPKGHNINPNGQKNIHIIIHIMHHRFHRLVHQNFLVHNIGR